MAINVVLIIPVNIYMRVICLCRVIWGKQDNILLYTVHIRHTTLPIMLFSVNSCYYVYYHHVFCVNICKPYIYSIFLSNKRYTNNLAELLRKNCRRNSWQISRLDTSVTANRLTLFKAVREMFNLIIRSLLFIL